LSNKAFVYHIGTCRDLTKGYVGITSKTPEVRLQSHKWNYSKFLRDGSGGCAKLYKAVKDLGGWTEVSFKVICVASLEYCLELEGKLRPAPNSGWNIRVGGDRPPMYGRKTTQATKDKLAEIRKTWVMSQESRLKLSKERTGSGNPMHKTPAWKQTNSSPETWYKAELIYDLYSSLPSRANGVKSVYRELSDTTLNYWSIDTMIRKFRKGYNPKQDSEWLQFKENYANAT